MNDYICFLDTEKEYMLRLYSQLNIRNHTGRQIVCYTERSSFEAGTGKMSGGICVIAEKDWDGDIAGTDIVKSSFVLILDEGIANEECKDLPHICKYESSEDILNDILEEFSRRDGGGKSPPVSAKRSCVIGVAISGLDGRDELFAFSLAGNLGKKGPSLLIDLGMFSPFEETVRERNAGLSDILYYMRSGRDDLPDLIYAAAAEFGNLSYIPTVSHPEDIREISNDDVKELIENISSRCIYEYIVIAFPLFMSDHSALFDIPRRVFAPVSAGSFAKNRLRSFEKYIAEQKGEDAAGKLEKILLPDSFMLPCGSSVPEEASFGKVSLFTAGVLKREFDKR